MKMRALALGAATIAAILGPPIDGRAQALDFSKIDKFETKC